MQKSIGRNKDNTAVLGEALISVYLPFLVVAAHEVELGGHWAAKIMRIIVNNGYASRSPAIEDYRIEILDFFFVWFSAVILFMLLRLISRLTTKTELLFNALGFFGLTGLPLVALARGGAKFFSIEILFVLLAALSVVWSYDRWKLPVIIKLAFIIAYFAIWMTLGRGVRLEGGWIVVWPSWRTALGLWRFRWFVYLMMGLSCTLLWAARIGWAGGSRSERQT